jgi:hypothetical protein
MATASWHEALLHERYWIPQETTARYTLQMVDEAGVPITLTQLTTATLTIYNLDAVPPVPIAGVWPRDVKNVPANGGAISSSGLLTLTLSSTDNALIGAIRVRQLRRWAITWTHATGTKPQYHQVDRVIVKTAP